ncbi:hypothetical protein P4O66_010712 [Electrophorus voltai]|uniref:HMG box domain-containing protein n=1 Tax=Electrophorus voltai TaxID=2609070 RepID=A0AAD8Z6K9_9TELE|nr:hypothetical protein P4O66_010712 [Electrophorus voltai]
MAPLSLLSIGASLLGRTVGVCSSSSVLRCSCIAPALQCFSTTAGPPRRPLSAYLCYVIEQQPIVLKQNPDVKIVDITRKIAQQWKTLTPDQKRPFEEASLTDRERYRVDLQKYQSQLTPAQAAAIAEEKRRRMEKRNASRKKRELNSLGKPKRARSAFNIFMAEHFQEAKGSNMQAKLKSLMDDWKDLYVYVQLAEDDKVRYKKEMELWEEHMTELGREDLVRQKEKKATGTKGGKNNSTVKVLKDKAPTKEKVAKKTQPPAKKALEITEI